MRQTYALVVWLATAFMAMPLFSQHQARPALSTSGIVKPALFQGLKWRNIGPFRGGRSVAVSGVAQNPMVYFMGSTGGGLWKTEDGGLSWFNISDGFFQTGSVGAVRVAASDPNIILVGMGEHAVRGTMTSHGDGVYKSTDGGRTWIHLGLSESRHIADIVIHPENPDIIFVAVQGELYGPSEERGVFKSTDGGVNWCKVLYTDAGAGACDLSIDPSNPRVLYAGMWDHRRSPWQIRSGGPGSGIYRSTDGGENWVRLGAGLPSSMGKVAVEVSPARPNTVYANIEAADGGVFRSDDGGQSWRQTSRDRRTVGRAWYFTELTADPLDPETVYVLNDPLLRSIDGGKSFEEIPTPHVDQHDLWINPRNPLNMILANDGGACVSFSGGRSWSSQYNQPTGQFYRVATDKRFPYHVYGGQQDHSSVAITSRSEGLGIGGDDWYTVAGCESAFVAFDPDDPELVFGGCYQGYLEVYRQSTRIEKDITAYPETGLAREPRTLRYRFNWNAPIVAQPQNPRVLYHAANRVLRSDDGGMSWVEISPDLTRNDPAKQGPGGVPFTNEGAGGEHYNTISYLACSPHQAGVIWAGSDDGRLHLTLDEGKRWIDVTPPNLGEALINCIEVSPHRPEAAYIVATRYKLNDLQPLIYHTEDFGRSWRKITSGIAATHFTRVLREDPVRPGLLYAGTEAGFYISFNNGLRWHRFQLNLPACPVTDLQIRDNDLVAATSGRAFWILDDLGALQQSGGDLPADRAVLFQPKGCYRLHNRTTTTPVAGLGQNPLPGLIIDYYLPCCIDSSTVTLQILDHNRRPVRTFTSHAASVLSPAADAAPERPLPVNKGLNRFYWDLRREPLPVIPDVYTPGNYLTGLVAPGQYFLRLITAHDTMEQTCHVFPDPRIDVSPDDYTEQQQALLQSENAVRDIHLSVIRMREVTRQLNFLIDQMKKAGCAEELILHGRRIQEQLRGWEETVVQTRQQTEQDLINFPGRLNAEFIHLISRMNGPDPRLTQGARQRLSDLLREWADRRAALQEIISKDLSRFNQRYKELDLPIVVLPSSAD